MCKNWHFVCKLPAVEHFRNIYVVFIRIQWKSVKAINLTPIRHVNIVGRKACSRKTAGGSADGGGHHTQIANRCRCRCRSRCHCPTFIVGHNVIIVVAIRILIIAIHKVKQRTNK